MEKKLSFQTMVCIFDDKKRCKRICLLCSLLMLNTVGNGGDKRTYSNNSLCNMQNLPPNFQKLLKVYVE